MEPNLDVINRAPLFQGIDENEIGALLKCLDAPTKAYDKNQFIFHSNESIHHIGLVNRGSVSVIREDYWGNRNIIAHIGPGELFAESYACTPGAVLDIDVLADKPSVITLFDVKRVLTSCSNACGFHSRLIRNLLSAMARGNLRLNEKVQHMSQRTTREKLLSYLSAESRRQGSSAFEIPFNRQQLADYLSVDRSAMSAELGKMQNEGLITFKKNLFQICG